ncbi:hypothetical protein V6V89_11320 [Micromonospora sp. CPCC 206061]
MMAALAQSVRVTIPNAAAWRVCDVCGDLAALAPGAEHCRPRRRRRRAGERQ